MSRRRKDNEHPILLRAAAARDALGVHVRPAEILVRAGRIEAVGPPGTGSKAGGGGDPVVLELGHRLVLPALANAHVHLDLTAIGPKAFPGSFIDWLRLLMQSRPVSDGPIAGAVEEAVAESKRCGVGYAGDIAHTNTAAVARQQTGLPGVTYLEFFGIGIGAAAETSIQDLKRRLGELEFEAGVPHHARGVILGLQPHAPYSAGAELYAAANRLGQNHAYRLSTHLAETPEEIEFVRDATGPMVELLRSLGKWDDSIRPTGLHPVDWLEPYLKRARWLLAHCNYVEDRHLELLARTRASVAYCPVASEYFGHGGGHRYRDMLEAGINVCLGTDSILCQNPSTKNPQPMGIFTQMRRLHGRDQTDPDTLLAMATVNGIKAMAIDETFATLSKGAPADLISIAFDTADPTDPLVQALGSNEPVERVDVI